MGGDWLAYAKIFLMALRFIDIDVVSARRLGLDGLVGTTIDVGENVK